jgi:hypothetical protein
VIGQKELEQFREEMTTKAGDAYTVLLKDRKLPMALLSENKKVRTGYTVFTANSRHANKSLADMPTGPSACLTAQITERAEAFFVQEKEYPPSALALCVSFDV